MFFLQDVGFQYARVSAQQKHDEISEIDRFGGFLLRRRRLEPVVGEVGARREGQGLHPVSLRRFPSFRTQPLENLTPLSMNKWVPEQPSPWRKSSKWDSCYGDQAYTQVYDTTL